MTQRIIVAVLVVGVFGFLLFYSEFFKTERPKFFDSRITYTNKTYRPYDTRFAFEQFQKKAGKGLVLNEEKFDYQNPNYLDTTSILAIVSPYFLPNQLEMNALTDYVDRGGNVLISAFSISPNLFNSILDDSTDTADITVYTEFPPTEINDSLSVFWTDPYAEEDEENDTISYTYPGVKPFYVLDSEVVNSIYTTTHVRDQNGEKVLDDVQIGKGRIFIVYAPITLSNYFLLHKQNYGYLNQVFDLLDVKNRKVIWDKFYERYKTQRPEDTGEREQAGDSYFWQVIKQHPPLMWAIATFFLAIALFILLYSRRMQASIRVIPEIKNNSIEFIKAVSGLYWLKQDHKKIGEKITTHFYDYLSTNYRFAPKDITLENIEKIAQKTDRKQDDIEDILLIISHIEESEAIYKKTLMDFYKKVYRFINS
jgi:hypothetical protein